MKPVVRLFIYGLFATACLYSCKSSKTIPVPSDKTTDKQGNEDAGRSSNSDQTAGIEGQVIWVEGNQMPQSTDKKSQSPSSGKGKPAKRTIRIHQLTHINQASLGDYLFGNIETPLVAEVETDEQGYFKVALPPGRYSIFTVEENGYFANVFDLDSYIYPLTVEKSKWNKIQIRIDYKAVY